MSVQRHVIRKQVIEVTIDRQEDASAIQMELNRIYHARIVPLIEQACAQHDSPDRLQRIDTLVLDIGHINLSNLESELVAKIASLLPRELARHSQERDTPANSGATNSDAELIIYFAYTGTLPWWANATQPQVLSESLRRLLHTGSLSRVLRTIVRDAAATYRFIRHTDDETLAAVCRSLLPAGNFAVWISIFDVPLRHHFWANLLRALMNTRPPSIETLYLNALQQTANDTGTSLTGLWTHIRQRVSKEVFSSEVAASMSDSNQVAAQKSNLAVLLAQLPEDLRAQIAHILQLTADELGITPSPPLSPESFAGLLDILDGLPYPRIENVLRILNLLNVSQTDSPRQPDHIDISNLLRLHALRLGTSVESGQHESGHFDRAVSAPSSRQDNARDQADDDAAFDLRFSEADTVYLENAGLVILWPFITQFFTSLDLIVERQFRDARAQQRAIALLHVLATGHVDFPEFMLPLNKILCALPLDTLFDFEDALSAAEIESCDTLLRAVIAQVPILGDMSAMGFRGTFLLRRGTLSADAGMWLLRVERATYDLVLDQFPWSWQWVRFPWMEHPLRVEW